MPTLIDNLNLINSYKSDIKSAIENKGVDMTGVSFGSYADKIGEITTTFVTETLNVTQNNTYYPGQGVDGFSEVVVNVPQTGYNEKDVTERNFGIVNLSNSASFVASYAFYSMPTLKTVYLPNCISINRNGFTGCGSLSSVYLPVCLSVSNAAFSDCIRLTEISLPACTYLGQDALRWCTRLSVITLPGSSICSLYDSYVFNNSPVTSIMVPYSLLSSYKTSTYWSYFNSRIFPILEELEFENGVVVGSATSMDSTYLTTLGISSNDVISVDMPYLTSLASSTFMDCQNLVSVSIPELGYIGDDMFAGCISLSEFITGVSGLGDRVFENCTSFETISLNYSGVVSIGSDVFNGTALSAIYIPYGYLSAYLSDSGWVDYSSFLVEVLPKLAYENGRLFGSISSISRTNITSLVTYYTSLKEVYLPDCQYVASSTFSSYTSMTSASLEKCRYVGDWGFHNCRAMTSLYLPNLQYMGGIALQSCSALTEIILPNCGYISGAFDADCRLVSIISIPAFCSMSAWYGNPIIIENDSLKELYLATDYYSVITYSWVFKDVQGASMKNLGGSIYVHTNLYNSYINAVGWSSLSSLFVSVGDANDVMLSYSDNMVYGSTKGLTSNFYNLLGVAINSIRVVSLPECRFIGTYALYGFTYLSGVYLGASDVCYMQNTNAIKNYVSIFVPASLVDAYKVAPNWSNRADYIFPIPE